MQNLQNLQHPRIALISALAQSPGPAAVAMRDVWPDARPHHLMDDSLAADLAALGEITPAITARFLTLGRYAASPGGMRGADGILFTCSAFGPCIDAVKADLPIPIVAPNEGAFEVALDICRASGSTRRIGLLLTFQGSAAPLAAEMRAMAAARGDVEPEIICNVAAGAMAALQAGDTLEHDRLVAAAAASMPELDVLVLGQFSMARALPLVAANRVGRVLTTPGEAVRKLRRLVEASATT
jgi:Asp/Glu/hydantoin racemase